MERTNQKVSDIRQINVEITLLKRRKYYQLIQIKLQFCRMQQIEATQYRRVKERYIWEVVQKVEQWRQLFRNGVYDKTGSARRLTLHEAADFVGIPKKTLEDYEQLIKRASKRIDLEQVGDKKMGLLRKIVRESKVKNLKKKPGRKPLLRQQTSESEVIQQTFSSSSQQHVQTLSLQQQEPSSPTDDQLEFQDHRYDYEQPAEFQYEFASPPQENFYTYQDDNIYESNQIFESQPPFYQLISVTLDRRHSNYKMPDPVLGAFNPGEDLFTLSEQELASKQDKEKDDDKWELEPHSNEDDETDTED